VIIDELDENKELADQLGAPFCSAAPPTTRC
jgi:hypothetical protein